MTTLRLVRSGGLLALSFSLLSTQPIPQRLFDNLPFAAPNVSLPTFSDKTFPITKYGAVQDGMTMNTKAFEDAITACAKAGGGHVVVPTGLWLTGPIKMQSNVDLHVEAGALVQFSGKFEDYPIVPRSPKSKTLRCTPPISGYGLQNVAVTGEGVFDGAGEAWRYVKRDKLTASEWKRLVASGGVVNEKGDQWWPSKAALNGESYLKELKERKKDPTPEEVAGAREFLRPNMVEIASSKNVLFDGPTFRNSPKFHINPSECENLVIRNVSVKTNWNAQNGDGIDIGSCHNVVLYNNVVDVGDDGICLKPGTFSSRKDWTVSCENIVIADCIVYRAHGGFVIGSETYGGTRNVSVRNCTFIDTDIGLRFKTDRDRGGVTERIFIDGIVMKNIANEAILFTSYYGDDGPAEGDISVRKKEPITGRTPYYRDFSINNIKCFGAGQAVKIVGLPESPVKNITLTNLWIQARQGVTMLDADGVTMTGFTLGPVTGSAVTITASKNISLSKTVVSPGAETFLTLTGTEVSGIKIRESNFRNAKVPLQLNEGAAKEAVDMQ